jgi:hypothetical protein
LHFWAFVADILAGAPRVTVITAGYLDSILLHDVSTTALKDAKGWDDFNLVFMALSKTSH